VTRNPDYSELNEDDVRYFKDVLGNRGVVEDELALESMNK
jgi:D-2-hydroxyglutarate dehydrogenase